MYDIVILNKYNGKLSIGKRLSVVSEPENNV